MNTLPQGKPQLANCAIKKIQPCQIVLCMCFFSYLFVFMQISLDSPPQGGEKNLQLLYFVFTV